MRAIGIGIPFMRRRSGAAIDAQAQAHFNRVIADGGLVPSGLSGVNAFFNTIKTIYGTSDVNTAISAAYDPQVLGYKLGAGSGTTLGQAAQKLYAPKDVFGGIGTGNAYWEGSGVNSNFISTPDAAANRFLNNIALWGKIRLQDYNVASTNTLVAKRPFSGNMSYFFGITAGGTLFLRISNDGNQSNANQGATSSVSLTSVATNGQDISVGVFRNSSTGDVIFYYSLDDTNWIQLGTTISTAAVGIFNTNLAVGVGGYSDGGSTITGRIYYINISATWLGTPSVLFNANQYTGANTWTSTTSEVWTVNSTGAGLADAVQTTAASQPLLLTHTTGNNYWFGSGVSGNFVSTPNAAANQITGDIEVIAKVNFLTVTGRIQTIISKWGVANNLSWVFYLNSANKLEFAFSSNGNSTFAATSSVVTGFSINTDYYVKINRIASTGVVKFYTSTNGVTYTQLGTDITLTSGNLFNSTENVQVGYYTQGFLDLFQGKIYRATISNSIGGAPVVDFNPNQYNPSNSQTQWVSTSGETWTINTGTATTGYKGVLVDRAIVQGDGIDDRMQATNYALTATGASVYSTYRKFASTSSGGFGVVVETGANTNTNQGILVDFNEGTNTSFNRIRGNVGTTGASFLDTSILLKLITSVFDLSLATDEASFYAINNSVLTQTGVANVNNTTMTTSGLNLMARSTAAGFANMTFNGIIISSNANGSTQRTAMYNYIRSINNAAF
jgi:hypothetical protein